MLVFPIGFFQDSYTTAVEKSTFTLEVPKGFDFQYKMYNLAIEPNIQADGKTTTYTWTAEKST